MITYTEKDERVTLEMSDSEFQTLNLVIGFATGAATRQGDLEFAYRLLRFVNRLNATNPHFTPYEIPAEFAG